MRIGIGLPNPVPGAPGARLVEWARRAEERGFSGLATIDRVVYPSYDSLATLAAAAGATTRIGLLTNVLLAPLYQPTLLAKSTASIDQLSSGRLTLGLSPGGRADDYATVGRDFGTRGRDFDHELETLHRAWRGELLDGNAKPISPTPIHDRRVPILIGGASDQAVRRVIEWGAGLTIGGSGPDQAAVLIKRVDAAWREAGRVEEPRFAALSYFSVGADADEDSRRVPARLLRIPRRIRRHDRRGRTSFGGRDPRRRPGVRRRGSHRVVLRSDYGISRPDRPAGRPGALSPRRTVVISELLPSGNDKSKITTAKKERAGVLPGSDPVY